MNYSSTPEFEKEFHNLSKKFRTLSDDLDVAKKNAIEFFHLTPHNNQSVFLIPGFSYDEVRIYKLKKFTCKSLKGRGVRSGIRIIYAFLPKECAVEFIEIYYKSDQESEDRNRILQYLKNFGCI
jgi:mRNA-degrading endonuclease RelE of RelBE toxin-antitoxin system